MSGPNLEHSMTQKPFRRLLLTGAAGNLGGNYAASNVVHVTDIASLGAMAAHEEALIADLADES
ncbi:hypothetical protein SBC1_76190 (plasmid) [Caballeronia sp. SBC1]|nr:hypothetical protein SBC2_79370 [Caballeronia sp. SBC2]QIN67572.1 hypothetical protein SBC1_76190 [Caballeronia sp. SBC1]